MRSDAFDFLLPDDLIAQFPLPERDRSRLMVLGREGSVAHRSFGEITDYLSAGDLLVLNDTRVYPARLEGRKESGGMLDILLVRTAGDLAWDVLSRGSYTGRVSFSESITGFLQEGRRLSFSAADVSPDALREIGEMPLPPYIRRKPCDLDKKRYQTVYAKNEGSIAAPTAGLHFTEELLNGIAEMGVTIAYITLHVGTGTFRLIRTDHIADHSMEHEFFEIDARIPDAIEKTKAAGKRIFAVGTTTTRAIEGLFSKQAAIQSMNGIISGSTNIFMYPGYQFRAVDCLVTNFHLPRSAPLLLASALAGREHLLSAYAEAIREKYRFFSYGDAMLIL